MASDLSSIIKEDISNTLESLLSATATIKDTRQATDDDFGDSKCLCVDVDFEFSAFQTVKFKFYIPTISATKFEFQMLGGIGDLKEELDDETADAVNEIISNICGSITTNINAQGFEDLGSSKFSIISKEIIECSANNSKENTYKFDLQLGEDDLPIYLEFASEFLPYVSLIVTGVEAQDSNDSSEVSKDSSLGDVSNDILSLLGEESIDNLKLLFDIKFKLSVRLGTKMLLLKDILTWDTGSIIELEQMVNEPLDILANGIKIGVGEAVIVEGKFGIKIKYIGVKKIVY